ncbi:probable ATP-dependent RNA helicase DDX52 [Lineus longissimus]|uniref:probable ATP-dependent RNA helicase DDX52 n=1 Tax=Lineus longissimus TaxID=88925 RepID=UPI002B4D1FEB
MAGMSLFRKLGAGAKFDFKRFQGDAERLKVLRPKIQASTQVKKKSWDSFEQSEEKYQNSSDDELSKSGDDNDKVSDSDQSKYAKKRKTDSDNDSGSSEGEEGDELSDDGDSEEEVELQILGSIKSNSTETKRHERKRKKKQLSPEIIAQLKQEKINGFRRQHRIHAYGTDIPDPFAKFSQLEEEYHLHSRVVKNIGESGYDAPTPIQMQAIPVMMMRREILACAPTGSGKTAAFLIPVLHHLKEPRNRGFRALILAPTRELAQQIYRECCRLADGRGFRIHYIDKASSAIKKFGPKSAQKFDILVTTPNRLVYLLKQEPPVINLKSVEWLIVDESDKLFEEGKQGFREQLAMIYKACDSKNVRRGMFSATFAHDVEEWCKLNLDNVVSVYIGARNAATDTVDQELLFVGSESGKLLAIRDIIRKGFQPPMLVFVQSKERAKELFHELIYDGINVDVIHADRTQLQRENVVKSFRLGKIWVLVCTELMGRGIDFKGVNLVVNYDFPTSAISYIHRIGRTGRAGRKGKAVTFFTEDDGINLRSIANVMKQAGCPIPDFMLSVKRPNKKTRKVLANHVPEREGISTVTQYDKEKTQKKREVLKRIDEKKRSKREKRKRRKSHAREAGGTSDGPVTLLSSAQKSKKSTVKKTKKTVKSS